MKRFTLFLVLALMATMLPAASPQHNGQPVVQAPQLTLQLGLPGLDDLTGIIVEVIWHVLAGPPVTLDPGEWTTANDGGGWVPNPPLPPPPPHP